MKKGLVLFLLVSVVSCLGVSSTWAEVVRGKVTAIDLNASRLSITTTEGESLALSFDKDDFIVWKGDDEVEAKEVQVGNEAEVGYYADEAGAKIASWVDLTPVEALGESELAPEVLEGEAAVEEGAMEEEVTEEETVGGQEHPGKEVTTHERPGKEHPGN